MCKRVKLMRWLTTTLASLVFQPSNKMLMLIFSSTTCLGQTCIVKYLYTGEDYKTLKSRLEIFKLLSPRALLSSEYRIHNEASCCKFRIIRLLKNQSQFQRKLYSSYISHGNRFKLSFSYSSIYTIVHCIPLYSTIFKEINLLTNSSFEISQI